MLLINRAGHSSSPASPATELFGLIGLSLLSPFYYFSLLSVCVSDPLTDSKLLLICYTPLAGLYP